MDAIFEEIRRALDARLYYLALVGTLALPDICAALESTDGQTTGPKYKAWCDQWLSARYPDITADDLWFMRCGVVHQGRAGHPKSQFARVVFTVPSADHSVWHNNVVNDALNLDIEIFCYDVIEAACQWYDTKQNDPHVLANLPRLMRYYPNGLAPYLQGMPVVA